MTPEEIANITPAEFYEKYWKIQLADGSQVAVKLPEEERRLWDAAFKLNEPPYVISRGRTRTRFIINPKVAAALKQ